MAEPSASLTASIWAALDGDRASLESLQFTGDGDLAIRVSRHRSRERFDRCSCARNRGTGALAHGTSPRVRIDRRLASFWFASSIRPIGWSLAAPWDPVAGDYASSDGWIRLHTNAPHHRAAAERVLGTQTDRQAMAAAVSRWKKAASGSGDRRSRRLRRGNAFDCGVANTSARRCTGRRTARASRHVRCGFDARLGA